MTTKDKIRKLGKELLLRRGYNAFSFSDISGPLNIKNAAIHYHYPTKHDLGVDILKFEQQRFYRWKTVNEDHNFTSEQRLERFFEIYEESLNLDLSICLVGSVSTDFMTVPEEMRENLKILVRDMTNWLIALLNVGLRSGEFSFKGDTQSTAYLVISSMAGSLQLSRVYGPDFFNSVKKNVRAMLGIASV